MSSKRDPRRLGDRVLEALEHAFTPIAVLRVPGLIYEYANRAYREVAGLPRPEGAPFGTAGGPESAAMRKLVEKVVASGERYQAHEVPIQVVAPDGGRRTAWYELRIEPVRGPAGEIDSVVLFSVEVTRAHEMRLTMLRQFEELQARTRALTESEARLRTVIESGMLSIVFYDAQGVIRDANQTFFNLTGYERAQLDAGQLTRSLLSPPEYEELDARALEQVAASGISEVYEKELLRRDGSRVHVLVRRARGLRDGESVAFQLDVTASQRAEQERRRLEAQVQHAQKLESLGLLASGIAHDFNNLLAGILGNASAALLDLSADHPAAGAINDVMAGARRASLLTRQMLAYSGKVGAERQPINLAQQVRELAALLRASINRSVELKLTLPDRLPLVNGDPGQLQQVIMNLVINAAEAIGDTNGVVSVSARSLSSEANDPVVTYAEQPLPRGRYVEIEVRDSGCGMTQETLTKLFDPFFTTKVTGRGLGLSVVIGIIRSHGGGVSVESEVGRGTTFRVYFPAAE